jgi:starch synthase
VKLLFVASEVFPLVKTGGLADVAGSLPAVLASEGVDVRILLPAYQSVLEGAGGLPAGGASLAGEMELAGTGVQILETVLPGTGITTWLLQHPTFSDRPGNPYHDEHGNPWPDNADRFMLLSRLAAAIASGDSPLGWRPEVLHCNDWHTGPAVALAHQSGTRPTTVFTIHNLAHLGIFDRATFDRVGLPAHLWDDGSLEFYGQCSFMKAGLVFADHITTVSPTYAREICEVPGGLGLEGLLRHRADRLTGILNGIDNAVWNPATDPHLEQCYDTDSLEDKARNKAALQHALGLEQRDDRPLIGFVGRLTEQKGLDLVLPVLGDMLGTPAQLVILGTGEPHYEHELGAQSAAHPGAMAVVLAYNETMAHRIEAASDIFLMPSLFEPCGLNQLYSLRYGTLPLVRAVGGLADTVVDADAASLAAGTATGFVFGDPDPQALLAALRRAVDLWRDDSRWRQMQLTAMRQDFSWQQSARRYLELYRSGR